MYGNWQAFLLKWPLISNINKIKLQSTEQPYLPILKFIQNKLGSAECCMSKYMGHETLRQVVQWARNQFYDCRYLRLECLASDVSWLWGHTWNPTWQSELVHITHSYHMRLHQQHHHTLCNMLEMNTTPPKLIQKITLFVKQSRSAKSVCYVLLICGWVMI